MATYNELIYNVKNLFQGGIGSDDYNVSDSQVLFILNYLRAKLIREDQMKGRSLSPFLTQEICLDMEFADKSDCCIETNCYILKSTKPVPKVVEVYDRLLITFIGSTDYEEAFPLASEAKLRWSKYNKYTADSLRSFLRNGYLYLVNDTDIEKVAFQAVFEQPQEVAGFKTCSGKPCFSLDDEYPVSAHMIPVMTAMIADNEMRYLNMVPPDITNNAMSDNT